MLSTPSQARRTRKTRISCPPEHALFYLLAFGSYHFQADRRLREIKSGDTWLDLQDPTARIQKPRSKRLHRNMLSRQPTVINTGRKAHCRHARLSSTRSIGIFTLDIYYLTRIPNFARKRQKVCLHRMTYGLQTEQQAKSADEDWVGFSGPRPR